MTAAEKVLYARIVLGCLVGGIFFALPGAVIVSARRSARRRDAILARGVEVIGTISTIDYANDSTRWLPTFAYRTLDGASATARSKVSYNHEEKDLAVVGSTMRILYDPQDTTWAFPVRSLDHLGRMRRKALRTPLSLLAMGVLVTLGLLFDHPVHPHR